MLTTIAARVMRRFGFDLVPIEAPDMEGSSLEIIRSVRPFTMTSNERIYALIRAVEYAVKAGIPGSIVECGVWKGGSMMAVASELRRLAVSDRELYLFDTFEGMTRPGASDVSYAGESASSYFEQKKTDADSSDWCRASLDEVRTNLGSTGYPTSRIHLVKGKVEDTVPAAAPQQIAVLRLDTDWYESTFHEMTHLYPRLSRGGVLIIDDYGYWQGSRRAVDDYFSQSGTSVLLTRVDSTARMAVKP